MYRRKNFCQCCVLPQYIYVIPGSKHWISLVSCNFELNVQWHIASCGTSVYSGLVALADNSINELLLMTLVHSYINVTVYLIGSWNMPRNWVSACSENAGFITQVMVKWSLRKLIHQTADSYTYFIQWLSFV